MQKINKLINKNTEFLYKIPKNIGTKMADDHMNIQQLEYINMSSTLMQS